MAHINGKTYQCNKRFLCWTQLDFGFKNYLIVFIF